jgi:hypothetical protein
MNSFVYAATKDISCLAQGALYLPANPAYQGEYELKLEIFNSRHEGLKALFHIDWKQKDTRENIAEADLSYNCKTSGLMTCRAEIGNIKIDAMMINRDFSYPLKYFPEAPEVILLPNSVNKFYYATSEMENEPKFRWHKKNVEQFFAPPDVWILSKCGKND